MGLVGCLVFRSTSQIQDLFLKNRPSVCQSVEFMGESKMVLLKAPQISSNKKSTHPTPVRDRWHFPQDPSEKALEEDPDAPLENFEDLDPVASPKSPKRLDASQSDVSMDTTEDGMGPDSG